MLNDVIVCKPKLVNPVFAVKSSGWIGRSKYDKYSVILGANRIRCCPV